MSAEKERCEECGELTHFSEQTIDLTGGKRRVFHLECWFDRCYQEAHSEELKITEDDCI